VRGHRFSLPSPPRDNPWWTAASLLLHTGIGVALILVAGPTFRPDSREAGRFTLYPLLLSSPDREVAMPAYEGTVEERVTGGDGGRLIGVLPSARIDTVLPPRGAALVIAGDVRQRESEIRDTTERLPGPPGYRLVGPEYGDGRVWVRTAEAELGVVGPSPDQRTHQQRIEQAVRERMKAYIDTMPRDSFALPPPPTWTTEIGDDKWGVDGSWIYLGDFKLPTALLALLPLPQGNYEQAQDAAHLQRMREEIIWAARRAETAEEFRSYVNELRKRKQAERDAERARRDTIIPDTPVPDTP
jgi:hypothetical protein